MQVTYDIIVVERRSKCKDNVLKEFVMNLLASTQVFRKKTNSLIFEYIGRYFCRRMTYSD